MGLIDRVKTAVSADDGEADDLVDEFEEEEIPADPMPVSEDVTDTEPEPEMEWETCYQFCAEMIEEDGFASMMDFTRKAMFFEIQRSPEYRNRLENGITTIERVRQAKEAIDGLSGQNGNLDPKEKAEKIKAVNELNDALDQLEGRDEQMVEEAMNLGYEALDAFKERQVSQAGNVESRTRTTSEEL